MRGDLSSPTHDPELHFGPKLGLGRQALSGTGRRATAGSVCTHLPPLLDKRAGPPGIKVLKSGALPTRSSKSQPFHTVVAKLQVLWALPPLLLENQQDGGSAPAPRKFKLGKYNTLLGLSWPQIHLLTSILPETHPH